MTPNNFRKLALSLPRAIESAHMHHPDFRVGGKIFATLGYQGQESAVVKLTPEQQKEFVQSHQRAFQPVKGAWGRRGYTMVSLPSAKSDVVRKALRIAWKNTAPKRLTKNR